MAGLRTMMRQCQRNIDVNASESFFNAAICECCFHSDAPPFICVFNVLSLRTLPFFDLSLLLFHFPIVSFFCNLIFLVIIILCFYLFTSYFDVFFGFVLQYIL